MTAEEYDSFKQRIANLTILEKTLNASIGNDDFASKLAAYKQSDYYLTKSIAIKENFGQTTALNAVNKMLISWSTWGKDAILARQEMLYTLSENIWSISTQ